MAQRVCPNCGHIENEYTYFCTECGSKTELKDGNGVGTPFLRDIPKVDSFPTVNEEPKTIHNSQEAKENTVSVHEKAEEKTPNNSRIVQEAKMNVPHVDLNQHGSIKRANNKYIIIAVSSFAAVIVIGIVVAVIININKGKHRSFAEESNDSVIEYKQDYDDSKDHSDNYSGEVVDNNEDVLVSNTADYEDYDSEDVQTEIDALDVNVESEVSVIREKYNDIMNDISDGVFDINTLGSGITAYSQNGDIKAVFVNKGIDNNEYSRKYYYDNGHLIFAYIEGNDANRLYFNNDRLFRWRYSPNALNPQDAVNHDGDYADGYVELETYALNEGYRYINSVTDAEPTSDYILPNSDKVYLTKSDLRGLSKEECRLARNELYARHGRIFDDEQLMRYFMQFEWYNPKIEPEDFEESMLNDYEVENRDLIVEYEKEMGYR